jgi:hypothetical protein
MTVVAEPSAIQVVVCGGPGQYSLAIPSATGSMAVSEELCAPNPDPVQAGTHQDNDLAQVLGEVAEQLSITGHVLRVQTRGPLVDLVIEAVSADCAECVVPEAILRGMCDEILARAGSLRTRLISYPDDKR